MNDDLPGLLRDELFEQEVDEPFELRLGRREFLQASAAVAVISVGIGPAGAKRSWRRSWPPLPKELGAWLHIGEDSRVTVYTGKVEVGQDIRTSLAQQVAEELRVGIGAIEMVMGDTDRTPWDAGTFGSRTTPTMGPVLRKAAATSREILVARAARIWKTQASHLVTNDGTVSDPKTGRSLTYGQLTKGEKLLRVIREGRDVSGPKDWKVAGRAMRRLNGLEMVTGAHEFASDVRRPGMRFGRVLRPAGFGGKLVSLDDRQAKAMPGVTVVREEDLIGVVAPDAFGADLALAALRAEWEVPTQPSNADLFDVLRKTADPTRRRAVREKGSIQSGLAAAKKALKATYTAQYIAHVPLEPRAAIAEWRDGGVTVWTGTQRPFAVRDAVARSVGVPSKRVRVLVPDTGSAYGGKHTPETAIEAAKLSRAARAPVRVVWTREEEMTWAYFRPATVIDVHAGAAGDGTLTAWECHNFNAGSAGLPTPYEVAHQAIYAHPSRSPLRQGSYRALAATVNTFARESHMDDLARALGIDPLAFRLKNLGDARLRAVLEAAAKAFRWDTTKRTASRGFGLACGFLKGSYVATCAEVVIDREKRAIRVARVVEAFECGAIVNPDNLRNQVEGMVVQALGGALFEQVRFGAGRIANAKLAQYRVPRFGDLPEMEVVLVDRRDLPPAGGGETPIIGLAPAIGNAIRDATGNRLRQLPLVPNGLPAP